VDDQEREPAERPRSGATTHLPSTAPGTAAGRTIFVALLVVVFVLLVFYWRVARGTSIVWTHFAYVPIALAGLWWGMKSVWLAALLGALVVGLGPFTEGSGELGADVLRACFFIVAALCVGTVSKRAAAARKAEEESRRKLDEAQRLALASERLASVGQLSAGFAHELNNPLGTILLYSHMLLEQAPEDDPKRDDIRMIASEAGRCKSIVRGLLDFARQSRLERTPTDVADLMGEVQAIMEPAATEKGASLTLDVEPGLPAMMVDAAQVKQMLVNLVQNGLDAVAQGGRVSLGARRGTRPETVEITVRDDGCGIRPEDRRRLFTPFFTTKEPGKGTGLGLAIAHGVVKMHSGDITVDSEPGKGTAFSIVLPVGEGPTGDAARDRPPGAGTPHADGEAG